MSGKECGHHEKRWKKKLRRFFAGFLIVSFIVLVIVLLIWAILQPKKPRFIIQDATVYNFSVAQPNFLTSSIQVTIASRNPNDKIGIYYDRLHAYAVYHDQQISYYTTINPVYQGHKDSDVWSPFVSGINVPIAPYNGASLGQDQADGVINLDIKMDGRVRFKVGTFISARYHLHVKCPAMITFGSRSTGVIVGEAVKYQLLEQCSVSI